MRWYQTTRPRLRAVFTRTLAVFGWLCIAMHVALHLVAHREDVGLLATGVFLVLVNVERRVDDLEDRR